jgi:hypothetical protein
VSSANKVFVGAALVIAICVGLVASFIYSLNDVNRVIAENVTTSSDWLEITPTPSLKPSKQTQYITLDVEGAKRSVNPDGSSGYEIKDWSKIELLDGTLISPDVQLVDEYGNTYSLRASMDDYAGKGFTADFNPSTGSNFPKDRAYRSVRIRSDKPIRCKRIIWHCHTGK